MEGEEKEGVERGYGEEFEVEFRAEKSGVSATDRSCTSCGWR